MPSSTSASRTVRTWRRSPWLLPDRRHLEHLDHEAGLAAQHVLDLLELDVLGQQRHRELDLGHRGRRDGRAAHDVGPLDGVALEQLEAELLGERDVLEGLDLLGQQAYAEGAAPLDQGRQVLAADGEEVDLDDAGELEEPLGAGGPGEVVEGQPEAGVHQLAAPRDGLVVDGDGLEHLDDRAVRRQGHRGGPGDHPALGVAEHRLVADELVEADGQGAEHDLRGHLLAADRGRVVALRPVEQLEPHDLLVEVDDRLAGDHDLHRDRHVARHRCRHRAPRIIGSSTPSGPDNSARRTRRV